MDFCENHLDVIVLKLRSPRLEEDFPTFDVWNAGWAFLNKLKRLSIEPQMLVDKLHNTTQIMQQIPDRIPTSMASNVLLTRKRKRPTFDGNELLNPLNGSLLKLLLQYCFLIEELEISLILESESCSSSYKINEEDLALIAKCTKLRKLTLCDFNVSNGHFLVAISKCCSELTFLRLKNLGPSALCCYTKNLCAALSFTHKLKTFR